MWWFWNNSELLLSVRLTPDAFVDAIKRKDTKMIAALVHNNSNDLTFGEMKLLSTAITENAEEIVTMLMNDTRINPAKYNDMFFDLVINKSETFYVKSILSSFKVMPSYNNNNLYKHYQSKGEHEVLVLIVNHHNFVSDEGIQDSVDAVKTKEAKNIKIAEEAKIAENAKIAADAKIAEAAKVVADDKLVADAKIAEDAKVAADAKIAEDAKIAANDKVAADTK